MKHSIGDIIGIVIAVLVLLFFVIPGVIGIGMTITFKLLQLALYLVVGWVMVKILSECLDEKKKEGK